MWIVTGANGFIGSAIVAELNQMGLENLLLVDTVPAAERPYLSSKMYAGFLHTDELFDAIPSRVEGVIHMGACSATTEMDVEFLKRNNTEYTERLWRICVDKQIPFIYASSGATYGNGEHGFDDEKPSSLYTPLNPYGWSKLNFDIWAEKETAGPPRWYGLRFFNVYGPNEGHKGEMSSVVYKAYQQIRNTGRLKLFRSHDPNYRDGEQVRDFVYVKDITRWIAGLMKADLASGIYNMGYGEARTWLSLATAVFKEMGKPLDIDWIDVPAHIRGQYQYRTEAKMTKWLGAGGPRPQWPLESGIRDYVQKHLAVGHNL